MRYYIIPLVLLLLPLAQAAELGDTVGFEVTLNPEACELNCCNSDEYSRIVYMGYALKSPSGIVVQQDPIENCADYTINVEYLVDEIGTWKLCGILYGGEIGYDGMCSYNTIACTGNDNCMEVEVYGCSYDTEYDEVLMPDFNDWLTTW